MNALLIAGIVGLGIWFERRRRSRPRRYRRPNDDALSHALIAPLRKG